MSAPVTEDEVLRLWERYESAKRMADYLDQTETIRNPLAIEARRIKGRAYVKWDDAMRALVAQVPK